MDHFNVYGMVPQWSADAALPLLAVFVISLKWNTVCYCGEACVGFI